MKLTELRTGQKAVVKNMKSVDDSLKLRLTSIGLMPGCELCMKQSSFFNGPCIFECRGQQICIRKIEADKIEVSS